MAQNLVFWSTLLKSARLSDLETLTQTSSSQKRELVAIRCRMKVFWNQEFAVLCRFNSIIIRNAFFSIFEEFHSTVGLIRKHVEHLVGLLVARQNQGEVR